MLTILQYINIHPHSYIQLLVVKRSFFSTANLPLLSFFWILRFFLFLQPTFSIQEPTLLFKKWWKMDWWVVWFRSTKFYQKTDNLPGFSPLPLSSTCFLFLLNFHILSFFGACYCLELEKTMYNFNAMCGLKFRIFRNVNVDLLLYLCFIHVK